MFGTTFHPNNDETGAATFQVVSSNRPVFRARNTTKRFAGKKGARRRHALLSIGVNDDFDLDWGDRTGAFSWVNNSRGTSFSMLRRPVSTPSACPTRTSSETFCADEPPGQRNDLFETLPAEMSIRSITDCRCTMSWTFASITTSRNIT
jgi:hypothetical protein